MHKKQKINVIDLDDTLIPFDSFSIYLFRTLRYPLLFFPTSIVIVLRYFRIISLSFLKKMSIYLNRKTSDYQEWLEEFSSELYDSIDKNIKNKVDEYSDDSTINILCTASPVDYSMKLAKKLEWECLASQFENSSFIHMHGENKIKFVLKNYPKTKFIYNFSISDSLKDIDLLNEFEFKELIKK